jgi:hypothetical protein
VAEDFDGPFQRLNVPPGTREIGFRLEGRKTWRVKVWVGSGQTILLDHEMEKGEGEIFEDRAGDAPDRTARAERPPSVAQLGAEATLRLVIRPDDASVYIDGAFQGVGAEVGLVRVSPGRHLVEVVRPGYRTEERELEVPSSGSTTELTVVLRRP